MIAAHYPKDDLAFVLIGQAESIRSIVAKYGELRAKSIADPGF